ncbi:MAG: DUF1294 domain-containing protein [Paracoccaceae bacterium]
MTQGLLIYFAVVNTLALGLSIFDKACVVKGKRRVPEREILYLSWMGGAAGAKLAQILCGTKTRPSEYFVTLNLIIFFQSAFVSAVWAVQSTKELDIRAAALTSWSAENDQDERAIPTRFGPGS